MKKRILIIGTGSIGERHLRCFQTTGKAEVAACEPNAELGRSIAARYGCAWFPSLEDAWASGSFDAAVLCTPAPTHIPLATTCLRRGLHVLIEKPLAVSLEGAEELVHLARESGKVVRVAYVYRAIPALAKLRELLTTGGIGAPRHITVVSGQHFPTFRPGYRTIYYANRAAGGGAIQDALTHQLNAVEWLAGPIESLFADAAHQVIEGVEVEDTVNRTARLRGGVLASFSLNQFQAPNETTFTIHGEHGSVRAELHNRRAGLFRHGESDWTWYALPPGDRDQPFILQAEAFLRAIDGEAGPLATLEEGIQTLRANIAALRSAETRCATTL